MRSILIISITFLFNCIYFPQINPGAKQVSLSNSDAATNSDVFALFNNPAGLSQGMQREAGVYYSPAPFGLNEMANGFVAYNEPLSIGSIAVGGMTYGFELYRENKFSIGYSYSYQNKFFIGTAINLQTVSIKNYGSASAFYLNIGGIAYLNNILRWGFFLHNVNRASFTSEQNQIPVIFNTGFSFNVTNKLTFHMAMEKDLIQNASVLFGVEYNLIKYFSVRTGFSNEPSKFSAGIGVNYALVRFDYAVFTHQELGMTHQIGLILSFDKNNQNSTND